MKKVSTYGYLHFTVTANGGTLLRTNNDRAFVISQLQDLLSHRLLLPDVLPYKQLGSCIDLLAFSITRDAIHLLVFSIDVAIALDFAHQIADRLRQYQQNEWSQPYSHHPIEPQVSFKTLAGTHQALARSTAIHLLHKDWEYDRYSSIGFYLHDRRGDWMHIWRLTNLYDNDTSLYRKLLKHGGAETSSSPFLTGVAPRALAS